MIPKNVFTVIDSEEGLAVLDSTKAAGSDWGEGGCAILAFALKQIWEDSCLYVIYNHRLRRVEHFGVRRPNGLVVDSSGVYAGESEWLEEFEAFYTERKGDNLAAIPYSTAQNTDEIVIDKAASSRLAELILE